VNPHLICELKQKTASVNYNTLTSSDPQYKFIKAQISYPMGAVLVNGKICVATQNVNGASFYQGTVVCTSYLGGGAVLLDVGPQDRVEHVEKEIKPALAEGKIVICDRYIYSSLAYQGSAGLSLDWIKTVNSHALQPDLAIFIDVSPERVLDRLQRKKSVMETLETQRKVREVYLKFVEKGELVKIDGNKSKEAVANDIFKVVLGFLKKI
jgi:hypothetical protein